MNLNIAERWESFKEALRFIFSWRMIVWPWVKIPALLRWWWQESDNGWYKACAFPMVVILVGILLALPTVTGYPIVWGGTYYYNYTSVIYPTPVKVEKTDQGKAVVKTLIALGDQMLVNWQDNDLPWSSSKTGLVGTDNPRNFQLGVLTIERRAIEEMREHMARQMSTGIMDTRIVNAYNSFAYTSDKWWLVSTESMYKGGVNSLRDYLVDVESGKAQITANTYNLDKLLEKLSSTLSDASQRLEDNRKGVVSWTEIDDNYYRAQGSLYATIQIMKATQVDFAAVLAPKQADPLLAEMIAKVETSKDYLADPLWVKNGEMGLGYDSAQLNQIIQNLTRDIDKFRAQVTK